MDKKFLPLHGDWNPRLVDQWSRTLTTTLGYRTLYDDYADKLGLYGVTVQRNQVGLING